jgi:hypothetical protein
MSGSEERTWPVDDGSYEGATGMAFEEPFRSEFSGKVQETLAVAGKIYSERNAVYKDNFRVVGKIMSAMFPRRSQMPMLQDETDFNRWHIFELFIVKLTRYAANWHKGGHADSIDDMIVYLGILKELDNEFKRNQPEITRK